MTNELPDNIKDRAAFLKAQGQRVASMVPIIEGLSSLWLENGGMDGVFVDAVAAFLSERADEHERIGQTGHADAINDAAAACMQAAGSLPSGFYDI
jgi:hypothetical protein